jgi:hypothetical protein
MKQLIQNLGVLIFIIASSTGYWNFSGILGNTLLIISGALILLGLFVHVISEQEV